MLNFVWVVAIVIQGVPVTEVGPFGQYGGCEKQMRSITENITTNYVPYDGTQWGLTDNVVLDDYVIECIRVKVND